MTDTETKGTGMDLTENKDGGILKEILREGEGDERPSKGDKVTVHYVGTLLDGTPFDSSRDRGDKFVFDLGKGQVIKSWDVGVASMRKGELARLTCAAPYAYGEQGSPPKIPPNATLVFEVELFSWKGDDVSPGKDGGIIKSTLVDGSGFQSPNDYASVTINYSVKYDGKSLFEESAFKFSIGESDDDKITVGLEAAVKKMKLKEKSRFTMSPKYCYGTDGNKELGIPGDSTLVYEIELTSFEKAKAVYEMDGGEKLEQAEIRKSKGTDFFKKGLVEKAQTNYNAVLEYLDSESSLEGEEQTKRDALVLAARLNLAACELKLGDHAKVIEHCNEALTIQGDSTKAFFRRGQALQKRKDYSQAVSDYKRVVELEPENKAAKSQMAVCNKEIQKDLLREKKLYTNMFSGVGKKDTKVGENGQA